MAPPNYDQMLAQWKLPGLNPQENEVAKRWLREKGKDYDSIEFNVPLGPVPEFGDHLSEDERAWAESLWKTRADIVATLGNSVTIIEVKNRLTKSAMGQLAHYAHWYAQQHPEVERIITRAIAAWADEGVAASTLANGVDVELYGGES